MRRLNMFLLLLLPIFIFSQTNEEFSIFSQILSEKIEKSKKKIVLQKETYFLTSEKQKEFKYKYLKTNFKDLELETFNDFKNQNNKKLNVTFIDNKEITALFKSHTGWEDFYKKYKNAIGIIEFSRIGFNKSKTQALLYYSKTSGFSNGHGNYIFLKKINGKWIKVLEVMAWIS
ncbi:hypothetical protein HXZ62_02795 [Empedobacter falsenii]|uniref:hypothetical protein n=1 Tax=Empedobacter falsenii TaxID=343874 RepID=UPI002575CAB0|nr:hypothetical protein [Empedobacter falsenii]MDM1061488.1 hypothetical protein [Empedobacter falsenii]